MTREEYVKLHGQKRAKLLAVETITVGDGTTDKLVEYDTIRTDGSRYHLNAGVYMLLIFLGEDLIPFTITKRQTFEKIQFYGSRIGQWFDVVRVPEVQG